MRSADVVSCLGAWLYWSYGNPEAVSGKRRVRACGDELFDNYLGMMLFALLGEGFWWVLLFVFFLAPRILCFCPVETRPVTGWGCCGQLPVPWPVQAYPLFMVLLGMSLFVSLATSS